MDNNDNNGIKKYISIGLTAISVIGISILIFFAVYRIKNISNIISELVSILQPIIFGLIIAYILNPVMKGIEVYILKFLMYIKKKCEEKKKRFFINAKKTARGASTAITLLLAGVVVFFLLNMVIPEIGVSVSNMVSELPSQINRFTDNAQNYISTSEFFSNLDQEYIKKIQTALNDFVQGFTKLEDIMGYFAIGVKGVFNGVFSVLGVFMNFIIGIIVSIYVLCSKETFTGQFKKILYAVFSRKHANVIIETLRYSDKVFSGFITGKLIDSIIIGALCFIGMSILRMPYAMLISVIVGVTNIIPFFGPYIGAIPSIFLILLVNPIQALYFAVFILILQQIDGNIIGPKILGDSTGLSAFWVMFAILVGGGLFGFVGMIVGVPLCAVIFYILNRIFNSLLEKKQLPVNSEKYIKIDRIDAEIEYIKEKEITPKQKKIKKNKKKGE